MTDHAPDCDWHVDQYPWECTCGAIVLDAGATLVAKLRDEDSYYRVQEKHWCIDAEELERQRRAAADRIEALTAENERLNAGLYQAQEIALKAWADKTEWVQQTCQNHELGLHRADVLRYRIEALTAEVERLREALIRLRDCDWVITPLDRMDAVRDIARAALGDTQ